MPFRALNSIEENLEDQAKQHSLELELEKSLSLYEDSLRAQRSGDDEGAITKLEELLQLKAFRKGSQDLLPSSYCKLKSYALRSYGILLLKTFLSEAGLVTYDNLEEVLDSIRNALTPIFDSLDWHEDPQTHFLIFEIARALGEHRLARLCIENLVDDDDNRPLPAGLLAKSKNARNLMSPLDKRNLALLEVLVAEIEGLSASSATAKYKKLPQWLEPLEALATDLAKIEKELEQEQQQTSIEVITRDWNVVAKALDDTVVASRKRKARIEIDDYTQSTTPIQSIQFITPHGAIIDSTLSNTSARLTTSRDATPIPSILNLALEEDKAAPPPHALTQPEDVPKTQLMESRREASIRSSKRVKTQESSQTLSGDFGRSEQAFSEQLTSFLGLCDLKFVSVFPLFSGNKTEACPPGLEVHSMFKSVLEGWDDAQALVFLQTTAPKFDPSSSIMQMLDNAAIRTSLDSINPHFVSDTLAVDAYISTIGNGESHIQQARRNLLVALLSSVGGNRPLILESSFPVELFNHVKKLLNIFAEDNVSRLKSSKSLDSLEIALAHFEILINQYLRDLRLRRTEAPKKAKSARDETALNQLYQQIESLRTAIGDTLSLIDVAEEPRTVLSGLRFHWISIFLDQVNESEPARTMERIEEFSKMVQSFDNTMAIKFPNCTHIPDLSVPSAETQISKYRAASAFAKVLEKKDTSEEDSIQTIELLESMLIPEQSNQIEEQDAILQFIHTASGDFKLSLWYELVDACEQVHQYERAHNALTSILLDAVTEMETSLQDLTNNYERELSILTCLATSYDLGVRLLNLIKSESGVLVKLTRDQALCVLKAVLKILHILQVFALLDQAINSNLIYASRHRTWATGVAKFRDMIAIWWTLFFYYYKYSIKEVQRTPETLNDVLSIVHEYLGSNCYCSLGSGALLETNMDEMIRLDWTESEADMLQCLRCRYGIMLATDTFTPFNHHTVPTDLTPKDSEALSRFVFRIVLSKKNLTQTLLRADVRQVIEMIYETLNSSKSDTPVPSAHSDNKVLIKQYLESPIETETLRQSLGGAMKLCLKPTDGGAATNSSSGHIPFMMGLLNLSLYRLKRRTHPARVEELFSAIRFYIDDLSRNTDRFESWVGLTSCYNWLYQASATCSYNMRLHDSSPSAVEYQRKAILAGCQAVSTLLNSKARKPLSQTFFDHCCAELFASLGELLFYSAISPCNMEAYEHHRSTKLMWRDNACITWTAASPSKVLVCRLACFYFELARKLNPDDWQIPYLQALCLSQLDENAKLCLDILCNSITSKMRGFEGKDIKSNEQFWIPFLNVILLTREFCESGSLTKLEAEHYYQFTGFEAGFMEKEGESPSSWNNRMALHCLYELRKADKKLFFHRPTYWIASLLWKQFHSPEQAQDEIASLFSLKPNSKLLLQIWKSDMETPGEHFVYMNQYIKMLASLYYECRRDAQLVILLRKIKKFTSISDYSSVWEHVCSLTVKLTRELLAIRPRYTEKVLPILDADEFEARSAALEVWVTAQKTNDALDPWVLALDFAIDLKKLNNTGSTSLVDELVISIYLVMFEVFQPLEPGLSISLRKSRGDAAGKPATRTSDSPIVQGAAKPENLPEPPAAGAAESATATPSVFAGVKSAKATQGQNAPSKAKKPRRIIRKDVLAKASSCLRGVSSKLAASRSETRTIPQELHNSGLRAQLLQPDK